MSIQNKIKDKLNKLKQHLTLLKKQFLTKLESRYKMSIHWLASYFLNLDKTLNTSKYVLNPKSRRYTINVPNPLLVLDLINSNLYRNWEKEVAALCEHGDPKSIYTIHPKVVVVVESANQQHYQMLSLESVTITLETLSEKLVELKSNLINMKEKYSINFITDIHFHLTQLDPDLKTKPTLK